MSRHSNGDRVEPSSDGVECSRAAWQDEGERSRPERVGQALCERWNVSRPTLVERVWGMHMNDQGVIRGTAFDREDARDRGGVLGVGCEPVDGLGGNRDEPACAEDRDSSIDCKVRSHERAIDTGAHARRVSQRLPEQVEPPCRRWDIGSASNEVVGKL